MIYIHIPFCKSFCTYCDFYSEICNQRVQKLFLSSILSEIESRRDEIPATEAVQTLYIGGGTPSVLPVEMLGAIVKALGNRSYSEFTVEVNPDDVTEALAASLRDMGVNRVSMGVQSFDNSMLRWMNRRHDAEGARRAFRILRSAGIENISIDLIFGISHLSDELWNKTLDAAIELGPQHISAYQLSIEEGSALAAMVKNGKYQEAPEDQCRRQYDLLCRRLGEAGYHHYEISNFALPGYEAQHNSAYWRRVPYVGFGPGAHSFDGSKRSWNSCQLEGYVREYEELTEREAEEEMIMLGLRTDAGVPETMLDAQKTERLLQEGVLTREQSNIRISEDYFFVSDDVIRDLI